MTTDWKKYKKVIYGVSGFELTREEEDFFKQIQPLGYIIFKRNIKDLNQLKALISALKTINNNENTPILIDQEGGRVARLLPPLFTLHPAAKVFGDLALKSIDMAKSAVFANYYLLGKGLARLGINFNCAPVADLCFEGAHNIIGDRSFGKDPDIVVELCNACNIGLKAANVQSIVKHIPGHGRALCDSHEDLPKVDIPIIELEKTDFLVFKKLTHFNWAMTAHIIYESLDKTNPATQSKKVIDYIRDKIGFNNVIISDDLSMKALQGNYFDRAKKSLESGCDIVLHCNGDFEEMTAIDKAVDYINDKLNDKLSAGFSALKSPYEDSPFKEIVKMNETELKDYLKQCVN